MVEHSYVVFGDPNCSGLSKYRVEKQTDTQTQVKTVPPTRPTVGMGK